MFHKSHIIFLLASSACFNIMKGVLVLASTNTSPSLYYGTIQGKLQLPESMQRLPPLNSVLVTLNDGEYSTYSKSSDGSFTFYNVKPGVHVLDVQSHTYHFSQIKIQLLPPAEDSSANANASKTTKSKSMSMTKVIKMEPNCIEYYYPGATKYVTQHPLILTAHATYAYFESRPKFSPFAIFKNPMVLMMVVSVGFMVLMPYMMNNLDPEQKEQMKKNMEMQQDPSKMLSQMMGEIMGKGDSEEKVGRNEKRGGVKTRLKRE
mmetsp:Transcript_15680/g.19119  ORF Transcript_15680/g.19119 Transcript_15680/m.19119 type:complete len:262 (-) Transcript_15680:121-906(-)